MPSAFLPSSSRAVFFTETQLLIVLNARPFFRAFTSKTACWCNSAWTFSQLNVLNVNKQSMFPNLNRVCCGICIFEHYGDQCHMTSGCCHQWCQTEDLQQSQGWIDFPTIAFCLGCSQATTMLFKLLWI